MLALNVQRGTVLVLRSLCYSMFASSLASLLLLLLVRLLLHSAVSATIGQRYEHTQRAPRYGSGIEELMSLSVALDRAS